MPSSSPTTRSGWPRRVIVLVIASVVALGAPQARARDLTKDRLLRIFSMVDRLIQCAAYQAHSGRLGCERARNRYAACAVESELFAQTSDCAQDKVFVSRMVEARSAELQYRATRWPDVKVGMTGKQVLERSNWGPPLWTSKTVRRGRTYERWEYGARRYLDLENGRVKVVGTSE